MIPGDRLEYWHQVCVSWNGNTGQGKFYTDGKLMQTRNDCKRTTIGDGKFMSLGHSNLRKYRDGMEILFMTGYVLWDKILTDEQIRESSRECQETKWNPVVTWNDFYKSVQRNAAEFLRTVSQCQATM